MMEIGFEQRMRREHSQTRRIKFQKVSKSYRSLGEVSTWLYMTPAPFWVPVTLNPCTNLDQLCQVKKIKVPTLLEVNCRTRVTHWGSHTSIHSHINLGWPTHNYILLRLTSKPRNRSCVYESTRILYWLPLDGRMPKPCFLLETIHE